MRLFVAVELPEDVKDALTALRTNLDGVRWTKREQFHLTLRFIGDGITQTQFEAIKSALSDVRSERFEMRLQGVGRFPPNLNRPPRVLWAGIARHPSLTKLYQHVDSALTSVGVAPDDHDFNPHITLGRAEVRDPKPTNTFLDRQSKFETRAFPVESFTLFSSVLSSSGAEHRREAIYKLVL
jgi:RNA 2',3'-cyclic 3'-phosphodiesterase